MVVLRVEFRHFPWSATSVLILHMLFCVNQFVYAISVHGMYNTVCSTTDDY